MSYTNTVLITGGTSGLGYHTALIIAQKYPNYLIVITGRSDPKSSAQKINTLLQQTNVTFLSLDLSSTSLVRIFTETWAKNTYPPITALLLNAGTQLLGPLALNPEGYEETFAINHLSHALLFHLLTPFLSSTARIVVTTSGTHDPAMSQKANLPPALFISAEELAHPNPETAHRDGMQRYNSSKLANLLWTYALARHLAATGSDITANAYSPGLMFGTGLARDWKPVMRFLWFYVLTIRWVTSLVRVWMPFVRGVEESAEGLASLAVGAEANASSGKYFEDDQRQVVSSAVSYDVEKQEDLWGWTVKALGVEGDGL